MEFDWQIINVENCTEAALQLEKINCDPAGIRIMTDKLVFKAVKLHNIPAKAANLLKQTFLAKGGEVAVARGSADLSIEYTDILIFATLKQYKLALPQLRMQPWGLPDVADTIEKALKNEGEMKNG
jgi:dihydropteroate synthase